ncbi:SLC13/DASS family transporter [Parashewanella curva]|uniref:SLC13/DASS family transporter n=1 Tax=Parashewanella curva TaxID=2338552 RepID=A0A3L8Q092_9GAMM|nr:SLC13 family permease [Parashewanella curva]RLV61054.1 SLC13/DASS family transporter [Parashewanella curva]
MKFKFWVIISTPLLSVIFYYFLSTLGLQHQATIVAAITLLTLILWVSNALPIPVTALLPFILFPIFDVMDHKQAASFMGDDIVLLLMGAFMLSKSLEKSGAHEKMAFYILKLVNVRSFRGLVFGIMSATAFLSLWISNTAATLVMLPITLAILNSLDEKKFDSVLLIAVAYAASIGGIGTIIGSPTNIIFDGMFKLQTGAEFNFFDWLKIGLPIVLISIPIGAYWLTKNINRNIKPSLNSNSELSRAETRTLIVFSLTIFAWITIHTPFGGWSQWLELLSMGESSVVLFAVIAMFVISDGDGGKLMDWKTAKGIPWDILLLIASGLCIAYAFHTSGLSHFLALWLHSLTHLSPLVMIFVICLAITFFTEIASNTATATLLMPIMASAAIATESNPELLMAPAAMATSTAFMLPVGTPPNAIILGSGRVKIRDMVKNGIVFSLLVSFLIALFCFLLI